MIRISFQTWIRQMTLTPVLSWPGLVQSSYSLPFQPSRAMAAQFRFSCEALPPAEPATSEGVTRIPLSPILSSGSHMADSISPVHLHIPLLRSWLRLRKCRTVCSWNTDSATVTSQIWYTCCLRCLKTHTFHINRCWWPLQHLWPWQWKLDICQFHFSHSSDFLNFLLILKTWSYSKYIVKKETKSIRASHSNFMQLET